MTETDPADNQPQDSKAYLEEIHRVSKFGCLVLGSNLISMAKEADDIESYIEGLYGVSYLASLMREELAGLYLDSEKEPRSSSEK